MVVSYICCLLPGHLPFHYLVKQYHISIPPLMVASMIYDDGKGGAAIDSSSYLLLQHNDTRPPPHKLPSSSSAQPRGVGWMVDSASTEPGYHPILQCSPPCVLVTLTVFATSSARGQTHIMLAVMRSYESIVIVGRVGEYIIPGSSINLLLLQPVTQMQHFSATSVLDTYILQATVVIK